MLHESVVSGVEEVMRRIVGRTPLVALWGLVALGPGLQVALVIRTLGRGVWFRKIKIEFSCDSRRRWVTYCV